MLMLMVEMIDTISAAAFKFTLSTNSSGNSSLLLLDKYHSCNRNDDEMHCILVKLSQSV